MRTKLQKKFPVLKNPRLRWELIILGGMYLGYGALMLCRTTLVVSGPAMIDDADLLLTKTGFGSILGWGMAGTLLGKLTCGIIADRFGGRLVFLAALCVMALAIVSFGAFSELTVFFFLYFLALLAKSAGWPSMASLIRVWFSKHKHGRVWGIISTSSRASSVVATLLLGSLLFLVSWRWLFVVAGGITALAALLLFKTLKGAPSEVGLAPPDSVEDTSSSLGTQQEHPLDHVTLSGALATFARSYRVWLICISLMCLTVLMEFQSFIPIYLKESFGLSIAESAVASSIFPTGCLVSVLAGGFIYDKISKKALMVVLVSLLGVGLMCLSLLWRLPRLGFSQGIELAMATAAILFFGIAITPSYYLPMSVFSIDFGGRRCGVLIGLIDAFGYCAAMVFDFVGGSVADQQGGWQNFLAILWVVGVAAIVSMSFFLYLDYRASPRQKEMIPLQG